MAEKILIVDDDLDTLRLVGLMLERQGYNILAASGGHQALKIAGSEHPDLILLDLMMPDVDGIQVARQLRANPETQAIPIIMFTAKTQLDDKLEGFDAGADAYLTKPTQPRELIAQVKAVLNRAQKARLQTALPPQRKGKLIGVIATKGGVGVSTVAVNLAILLQQQHRQGVTLADFRPGCGTIGLELGYFDSQGLNRLLEMPSSDINLQAIETVLVTHSSQVRLLLSSADPKDAKYFCAVESFLALANYLPYLGDYTVLDLGVSLTPVNEKVLELCDLIVLVIEPVANTVDQSKSFVEYLSSKGISGGRILYALINRVRTGMQLSLSQVQDRLGRSVSVVFTPAPEHTYQAIAAHTPIVLHQPECITTQQFLNLAGKIVKRSEPISQ